jgi:hypothetical protein
MPVILAFGRQRQKDHKFKASLSYRLRPCLKTTKTKQNYNNKITLQESIMKMWKQ